MSHIVKLETFEGPLDLLLRLAEESEFDLTTISLAQICNDYLAVIRANRIPPEELADFLAVASKLLLLKASGLIPDAITNEEKEGAVSLADQLKLLAVYVAAGRELNSRYRLGEVAYARDRSPVLKPTFSPPPHLYSRTLAEVFQNIIGLLEPIVNVPTAVMRRVLSLEHKLTALRDRVTKAVELRFSQFVGKSRDRQELIISFLALLELVKQHMVEIHQPQPFDDIVIRRTN